jgi:ComF family protein
VDTEVENVRGMSRRKSLAAAGGWFARWCRGAALELLYPAACVGCGIEVDAADETPFCAECLGRLPLFQGATCVRCGGPVPGQVPRNRCYTCGGTKLRFDETVSLGRYDGLLRDWLLRMKHGRGESLTLSIAKLIWRRHSERLAAMRPDVVAPVPMHWRRRLVRGTNSPAILAERLAEHLRVPHAIDLLRRTRHTPPQFSLPPSERPANVRNAFVVRPGYHLRKARVLLVDDILTTGSTCSAAARALKQAGAAFVAVAVVARTLRH